MLSILKFLATFRLILFKKKSLQQVDQKKTLYFSESKRCCFLTIIQFVI